MKKNTKTSKAVNEVKSVQINTVMNEIGNLQTTLLTTLSGISSKVAEKLEFLANTEIAVGEIENRLSELYGIEKEAQNFEDVKVKFSSEHNELENKISEKEIEWQEKQTERLKNWAREEEQCAYDNDQKLKRFEDQFKVETEAKQRAERLRGDELVKSWNTRESMLADKENEYKSMQVKVAQIDSLIKAECDKIAGIVKSDLKNSYEHHIQLLNKDRESEQKQFAAREQSLQVQVGQLVEQVAELNKQLAQSRQDAKDVTSAALNSASGRAVVEALQRASDSKDAAKK
jgi:hypothetical protein